MAPRTPQQHIDRLVVELAARQHDVIALEQLRALGLENGAIDVRLAAGWLTPLHRGVFAVGRRRPTREGRFLAAVLACGPGAALSHRSAAVLLGLLPDDGVRVDVTIATRNGRRRRDGIAVHRPRRAPTDEEVTVVDGIPVTSWARTLLDLAAVVPQRRLARALERSEELRLFDLPTIEGLLAAHCGRRSAVRVVRALELWDPVPTRSELERMFFALCAEHGLPRPQVNTPIGDLTVDFTWPGSSLVVETDGYATHGTRAAFERDRARDATLALAGYVTQRFSRRQVKREPVLVAATVRARLDQLTPRAAA
jgi:very-short-patch-repair endonuclease